MLKRLRLRRAHGLSLFGSLMALAVIGVLLAGAGRWLETQLVYAREDRAAARLVTLTTAAQGWALANFPTLLAGPPTRTLPLATLVTDGFLGAGFPAADAMSRGSRILLSRTAAGVVEIVVTQTVGTGDVRWPWRAVATAPAGIARIGTVAPAGSRIAGPTIDVDVSAFQAAFAGDPAPRALAAHVRLDRQSVYGDQLYRTAVAAFPELNRMETALDLAGNDLVNAGAVSAQSFAIDTWLDVAGALTVTGDLVVGGAASVAGATTIGGALTAASASVTGPASVSGDVTVTGAASAASLAVTGTATAATIASSGDLTVAGGASVARLAATSISADSITVDDLDTVDLRVRQVRATGRMRAASAGITSLVVGSCTGC